MKKCSVTLIALVMAATAPATVAFEKSDMIVRVGVSTVSPDDSSSNILVGSDLGFNVKVDDNTQLGLNFAYFLTGKINVEVLAATPFAHDVDFGVSNPLGTGDQLGEVTHLPLTVTVNYYFNDSGSRVQPYVGVGINYTVFFEEEFTSKNDAAGLDDLSLDDSWGIAAQIGADYMIDDKWFVNGSVRWIDIDTEAEFNLNGAQGSIDSIEIDPWVYTVSVGYTF